MVKVQYLLAIVFFTITLSQEQPVHNPTIFILAPWIPFSSLISQLM